jgi:hypothetical protein
MWCDDAPEDRVISIFAGCLANHDHTHSPCFSANPSSDVPNSTDTVSGYQWCRAYPFPHTPVDRCHSAERASWVGTTHSKCSRGSSCHTGGTRPGQTWKKPKDLSVCDREDRSRGRVGLYMMCACDVDER